MRLRILTRASDLARLQGEIVARRLRDEWPGAAVELLTRESSGDRDTRTPLWQMGDKGAFTRDLSDALGAGHADIVVHSWKDLPIEPRPDTTLAATLPREDARDVLLVREDAASARPPWLRILTSSPRRALMVGESLPPLLPWTVETIECAAVRGNVPTRIGKLMAGDGDALIVAKAALDRLLDPASPMPGAGDAVRRQIAGCRWMVLPLREFPSAAAQGALALEIAASNRRLGESLNRINDADTWRAATEERQILSAHGGGCHQAIGVAVRPMPFGDVISVRGRTDAGSVLSEWRLRQDRSPQPRPDPARVWPRPAERGLVVRRRLDLEQPASGPGFYVTHPHALPQDWRVDSDRLIWAAGSSTWRELASRGIWVCGSSEGLGHFDPRVLDRIAGRQVSWHRLTHAGADVEDAIQTYAAESVLPADLHTRTHFFWRSGSEFRKALELCPAIRDRWHACGPGHTFDVVGRLAGAARVRPALGYQEWLEEMTQ